MNKNITLLLCLFCMLLTCLSGCIDKSDEGAFKTTPVTIIIGGENVEENGGIGQNDSSLMMSVPGSEPKQQFAIPPEVRQVILEVKFATVNGIQLIERQVFDILNQEQIQLQLQVQSGPERWFTVKALNNEGVTTHYGKTMVDLKPNRPTIVNLIAQANFPTEPFISDIVGDFSFLREGNANAGQTLCMKNVEGSDTAEKDYSNIFPLGTESVRRMMSEGNDYDFLYDDQLGWVRLAEYDPAVPNDYFIFSENNNQTVSPPDLQLGPEWPAPQTILPPELRLQEDYFESRIREQKENPGQPETIDRFITLIDFVDFTAGPSSFIGCPVVQYVDTVQETEKTSTKTITYAEAFDIMQIAAIKGTPANAPLRLTMPYQLDFVYGVIQNKQLGDQPVGIPEDSLIVVPGPVGRDVLASWQPAPEATGYLVFYDTDELYPHEGWEAFQGPSPVEVPAGNVTQLRLSDLTPGQEYFVSVAPLYGCGYGEMSKFESAVPGDCGLPADPDNVTLEPGNNPDELDVGWDGVVGADGYRLYYGNNPGGPYDGDDAQEGPSPINIPGGNATNFTLSGLATGPDYYVVVTAYTDCGESDFSPEASGNLYGDVYWARSYGETGDEAAFAVDTAPDGGYIAAGMTTSGGAGGQDAYVVRTDRFGAVLWEKAYGTSGNEQATCVRQADDGGFILSGVRPLNQQGFWLWKIDENGDLEWEYDYTTTPTNMIDPRAVRATDDDGFIVAGSNNEDAWVIKTDDMGGISWDYIYFANPGMTGWETANDIQQTTDGGYIVAGEFGGDGTKAWLFKLTSNGAISWQCLYDDASNSCSFFSVDQTSDGGYIAAGNIDSEFWAMKVDNIGDIEWQKQYAPATEESYLNVIRQIPDGGYITVGSLYSYISPDDYWYAYAAKLNSNGNPVWEKRYGLGGEEAYYMVEGGSYTVTGYTNNYAMGGDDLLLMHIDDTGEVSDTNCPGDIGSDYPTTPSNTSMSKMETFAVSFDTDTTVNDPYSEVNPLNLYMMPICCNLTDIGTPQSVVAVPGINDGELDVSWNPVDGAMGYYLYYDTDSGSPYEGLDANEGESPIDVGSITNFTLSGLSYGMEYFVVISAYNPCGEGDYSDEASGNAAGIGATP